jgi:hypothetical protein
LQNNTINNPVWDGISAASTAYGAVVLDGNTVNGLLAGRVATNDNSSNFAFFSKIVATAYNGVSGGITNGTASGGDSGTDIENIANGSYAWYNSINLTGITRFIVRAATALSGGNIEIRLGSATGTLIGTCAVTNTGGWHNWKDFYCDVSSSTTQNVYLKFTGGGGGLMNVQAFAFTDAPAGALRVTTDADTTTLLQRLESYPAASSGIIIYPNPVDGQLKIGGLDAGVHIIIRNQLGQVVLTGKTSSSGINVSRLTAGTYFISTSTNKAVQFIKN